jgi:hypothetical protein
MKFAEQHIAKLTIFALNKSTMQNPKSIYVMPPRHFGCNTITAENNYFQEKIENTRHLEQKAAQEHELFRELLQAFEIRTFTLSDDDEIINSDAVFLNNWFSVMPNKTLVIYPMWAKNRRTEVRADVIDFIKERSGIEKVLDYTTFLDSNQYCEGTGSIIFDFEHKKAYACISDRTDVQLFEKICVDLGFTPISFLAEDINGNRIYHTNVMLSIGENIIVVCSDAIADALERHIVMQHLETTNRLIIDISFDQMNHFGGNVFEVTNKQGEPVLCMSSSAKSAFTDEQLELIQTRCKIMAAPIPNIEKAGGGSVRCMIAANY